MGTSPTSYASANNLKLNINKSHEMIVHHPSKKLTFVPPLLEKITRTHELTVLGVTFNSTLSFSQYVQNLSSNLTIRPKNTKGSRFAREGTVGSHAGYTRGTNNLCQPLIERVYQSRRSSTLKGYTVKSMPIRISPC